MSVEPMDDALLKIIGPRCKTQDVDDFAELKDESEGRCFSCLAWEAIDRRTRAREIEAIERYKKEKGIT